MCRLGGESERRAARAKLRLARHQRLRRRSDYVLVQRRGRRVVSQHFVFLIAAGAPGSVARLGITATRKIGGAVARNRAKRLVREAFRHRQDLLPRGVDMVVLVRGPLGAMQIRDVMQEWDDVRVQIEMQAAAALRSPGTVGRGTP